VSYYRATGVGLIVYQATKAQFLKHALEEDIHDWASPEFPDTTLSIL
jgi:hypothetical protein